MCLDAGCRHGHPHEFVRGSGKGIGDLLNPARGLLRKYANPSIIDPLAIQQPWSWTKKTPHYVKPRKFWRRVNSASLEEIVEALMVMELG
jgi:hypothetical protein